MADLLINGQDAFQTWGVRMGEGFLDSIDSLAPMKEFIESKSRLEHGKRVSTTNPKLDERDLTLSFTIQGSSQLDYSAKKKAFQEELYKGSLTIQVPPLNNEVYHLTYTGKSVSYGLSLNRTFGKISAKFNEPNPANRTK